MATINLSLISHTNIGKTTLARTLLRREVGDIRDSAHVTDTATAYTLIDSPAGDTLRLWDTPGFGDSARLLRRLEKGANPLGWFLSQVWDRYADRPFFSSQLAVRNVRDAADVVLYLVNAVEDPAGCGYLDPEMRILGWMGKPVLVLLNQLGAPRPAAQEQAEVQRWAELMSAYPWVHGTLAFDAFARCWVQEQTLLEHIGAALPEGGRERRSRVSALPGATAMKRFSDARPTCWRRNWRRSPATARRSRLRRSARRPGPGSPASPAAKVPTPRAPAPASRRQCGRSPRAPTRTSVRRPTG